MLSSTKGHRVHGNPHLSHGEEQCANTISLGKRNLSSFYKSRTLSCFFLAIDTAYWFTEMKNWFSEMKNKKNETHPLPNRQNAAIGRSTF